MQLAALQKMISELAAEKNWGTRLTDVNFAEKIALLHQEVSEVLEAYRKQNMSGPHGIGEELADVMMRVTHLAVLCDVDLVAEIEKKFAINKTRDWSGDQLSIDRAARLG